MKSRLTSEQRLRALLVEARWCLADDVRAAGGGREAERHPGMKHRAQLARRIERELARTRPLDEPAE